MSPEPEPKKEEKEEKPQQKVVIVPVGESLGLSKLPDVIMPTPYNDD